MYSYGSDGDVEDGVNLEVKKLVEDFFVVEVVKFVGEDLFEIKD